MNQFNPASADHDDFQFKPLTEGLGFHKKSQEKAAPQKSSSIQFQAEPAMDLTINPPLPRKGFDSTQGLKQPAGNTTVDDILKTLNEKRSYDFAAEKKKLHEPAPIVYKKSSWDLSAGLLDAMLVTAATLLCLIVLLLVTKVDLFANLYRPDSQGLVYLSLVSLVAGVTWIYLVGHRVFLGFTPGEWVFDQRLGRPEELGTSQYALKAIARSTIVLLTGFMVFPLISFAMNRDYLGQLLGVELVKRA
ncbi:MAG: metalloendopeptidase [Pseudobdellovibrionaceae bacterium]